jgi:hypothetical protein
LEEEMRYLILVLLLLPSLVFGAEKSVGVPTLDKMSSGQSPSNVAPGSPASSPAAIGTPTGGIPVNPIGNPPQTNPTGNPPTGDQRATVPPGGGKPTKYHFLKDGEQFGKTTSDIKDIVLTEKIITCEPASAGHYANYDEPLNCNAHKYTLKGLYERGFRLIQVLPYSKTFIYYLDKK